MSNAVRLPAALAVFLALTLNVGCASVSLDVGYYWQSISGHLAVMRAGRPISEVLAEPELDAKLRGKLELVREIRRFASRELGLPDNGSYTRYADLKRPFVLWNIFATPELSMKLVNWCFPVAGCISYRGYYAKEDADRFAAHFSLYTRIAEAFHRLFPGISKELILPALVAVRSHSLAFPNVPNDLLDERLPHHSTPFKAVLRPSFTPNTILEHFYDFTVAKEFFLVQANRDIDEGEVISVNCDSKGSLIRQL